MDFLEDSQACSRALFPAVAADNKRPTTPKEAGVNNGMDEAFIIGKIAQWGEPTIKYV